MVCNDILLGYIIHDYTFPDDAIIMSNANIHKTINYIPCGYGYISMLQGTWYILTLQYMATYSMYVI